MRGWISIALLAGCANDPVYLGGPASLEAGVDDGTGVLSEAKSSLTLPIKLETAEDTAERAQRTATLGVDVPYVKLGDLEVSVEWTIRNLDTEEGTALVQLNGANEVFAYDPDLVEIGDPDDNPPVRAPGLDGDIPLRVPAGATISGLFREDQLREASIDLDQITRANVHPYAARLEVHKHIDSFQPMSPLMPGVEDYEQMPIGDPIPRAAFRQIIRVDLVFRPDHHMTLDYVVRVRDTRGLLHDLLDAAVTEKPDELTTFVPMDYAVMYTP